jgi:hypothetical protein
MIGPKITPTWSAKGSRLKLGNLTDDLPVTPVTRVKQSKAELRAILEEAARNTAIASKKKRKK